MHIQSSMPSETTRRKPWFFVGRRVNMKSKTDETVAVNDIVDTAAAVGSFKTFLKALRLAGLEPVLRGNGPFTVFAPVDDAFKAMSKETQNDLFKDRELLEKIMKYHIVPGKLTSDGMARHPSVDTLEGRNLVIQLSNGINVNGAKVTEADIECSNGVIHAVDLLLVPKPGSAQR